MGMFDDVFCERPLPDGWEHKAFQSKDFDCNLDHITIGADGRLRRASFDRIQLESLIYLSAISKANLRMFPDQRVLHARRGLFVWLSGRQLR